MRLDLLVILPKHMLVRYEDNSLDFLVQLLVHVVDMVGYIAFMCFKAVAEAQLISATSERLRIICTRSVYMIK